MKDCRLLWFLVLAALLVAAPMPFLHAHAVPPRVTAYVKPLGDRLRVIVRIPTAVLADPRLPVRSDGYFDLQAGLDRSARSMSGVMSDVARNLDLMDDDRLLAPAAVAWTISPASDRSFDTFGGAEARVAALPPLDARIDPGEALLDLQLDYPLQSGGHRLSVRVNGYRGTRDAEMAVHYILPSGAARTVVTSGTPRRLELEPRWRTVASAFGRLGIEQLALGAIHLMFVLCLAIPARSMRLALGVFGWFAASWAVALMLSAFLPESSGSSRVVMIEALAAGALAVAGIQNITAPRLLWVQIVAAVFGVLDGLVVGIVYRQNLPLAGSFPTISFVSFLLPILLGSLWFLVVAHAVVTFVRRSRLPERWATVLLSAIPIHAALHAMIVKP